MTKNNQYSLSSGERIEVRKKYGQNEKNFGKWSKGEQLKYMAFLKFFKNDLKIKQKRKFFKIFKLMAQFLQTRDGVQCRSHHMKQLKTHKKVKNIIQFHQKDYDEAQLVHFDEYFDQLRSIYSQFQESDQQKLNENEESNVQQRMESQQYMLPKSQMPILNQIQIADIICQMQSPIKFGLFYVGNYQNNEVALTLTPYITFQV